MVDIVVLNFNDYFETLNYVNYIKNYGSIDHIIIVDNCSTDGSYDQLIKVKSNRIHVIQSKKNGGYGYGNNTGIKYALEKFNSKYIAITNPDVKYTDSCLNACENFLKNNIKNGFMVCAPVMKNSNNEFVESAWMIPNWFDYVCFSLSILGKIFKLQYVYPDNNDYSECQCIAGSMIVFNANVFEKGIMYDEHIFLYCEEMLMGINLNNAGYKTALLNNQEFIHAHSVSINKSISSIVEQQKIMWQSRLLILKEYYKVTKCKFILANILSKIGIFEERIRLLLRKE